MMGRVISPVISWVIIRVIRQGMMQRRRFLSGSAAAVLAGFSVGGALLRAAPVLAQRSPLRIGYPDKSPPNSWATGDGNMHGMLVDLTAAVAQAAGHDFTPVPLPLPRVQAGVETGALDGMCLTLTPDRLRYAIPTAEPLTTGTVTLFLRRDNPVRARLALVRNLDDLAATGATVIAVEGNGWIRQNVQARGIRTVFANGTIGTVRMLVGGRGDVIADMSHQINWLKREVPGGEAIEELPAVMDQVDWPLLISRKSPVAREMARLDTAIRDLKAAGAFDPLYAMYGVKV